MAPDDGGARAGALAAAARADVVMLATGAPAAWDLALAAVDKGGVIQWFAPGKPGQRAAFDVNELFFKELEIQATYSAGPRDTRAALDAHRLRRDRRPSA